MTPRTSDAAFEWGLSLVAYFGTSSWPLYKLRVSCKCLWSAYLIKAPSSVVM